MINVEWIYLAIWLRQSSMVCYFEHGNETTDSKLFSYLRQKILVTKIFCNYVAGLHIRGGFEVREAVLLSEQRTFKSLQACDSSEGFSPTSV